MKPSVVVAIVLVLCVYLAPRCKGQERSNSGVKGTTSENQKGRPPAVEVPYQIQNQWIQTETSDREKESPPWYKSPEWVLVIVGIITFFIIGWQSWETRKAANAAIQANAAAKTANSETLAAISRQADLMEGQIKQATKHLTLIERPWISPVAKVAGPLTDDGDRIGISLSVELSNIGKSPSVGMHIKPVVYAQSRARDNNVERKRVCAETLDQAAAAPDSGEIIFPNTSAPAQRWNIGVPKSEIEELSGGKSYVLVIILCVAYRSTLDDSARHYTCVTYHLMGFDPQHPVGGRGLWIGDSVPVERLRLHGDVLGPIAE
jgi:hypothetical protein